MERFNPITDLQPIDPIDVPNTQVSDELESLRLRLKVTQEETSNIIQIIKEKNDSLNSDLKKLKNFNRRLNITIPRIPEMPGEAGVEFGEEAERERKRKAGFRLPPRFPLIRKPVNVPQFKRPKLRKTLLGVKKGADIIGYTRGGGLVFKTLRNPKAAKDAVQAFTKGTDLVDDVAALGKSTRVITKKFQNISKSAPEILGVKRRPPKVNFSDLPLKERMRIAALNKKNFPKVSERRGIGIKKFEKLIGKNPEAQFQDYLRKSKLSSPLKLKIDLNKAYQNERTKLLKSYRSKKIDDKTFTIKSNKIQKEYLENVERINRYDLEVRQQFEKVRNFFRPKPKGRKSRRKPTLIDDFTKKQKQIKKEFPEAQGGFKEKIDKSFRGDVRVKDDGTFEYIDTLKKDPNLISLNTDTGVTNTVIIITDPPIA